MSGEEIFVTLLWSLGWIVVGRWIAMRKGRWTTNVIVALFLFGPVAIAYLIFAKKDQGVLDNEMVKKGIRKKCPFCINIIDIEAILCSFCNSDLREVE